MKNQRKWTKELIAEKALEFTTRTEFKLKGNGAYNAAQRNGILNEVCGHMPSISLKWTNEALKEEAKNYTTRTEFARTNAAAYGTAIERGLLEDICQHMKSPPKRIPVDVALKRAKEYTNLTDFRNEKPKEYAVILRNKCKEEAFSHMLGKYTVWTDTLLVEEALKHSNTTSFRKSNAYAHKLASNKGLLKDLYDTKIVYDPYNIGANKIGVYILYRKNKIVYVGKSLSCIRGRVNSHRLNKDFDSVEILSMHSEADIHILEIYLIVTNFPEYNNESFTTEASILTFSNIDDAISNKSIFVEKEH